jgi:aminoglycoside phosphotransferase (APT) family kinase protein
MTLDRQTTYSGTKNVAPALAFDAARLDAYLSARLPGFAGPMTLRQFKGGQSNPTYLIQTPTRGYVMRRKPPGKLLPSAHAVDREFRAISALHPQRFPVAEPLLYCADADVVGTAFYVMSFVDGRVIWEPSMPTFTPAERGAVYAAMNATLAQLHQFDPAALGLGDFGKGENYVGRQIERWSKQYRASQTQTIDEMEELIAWLPAHVPRQQRISLVHGDYRLDNMVLADSKPELIAVLDWELSTLGDPLADFTYHLMQWEMPASEGGPGIATLQDHDLAALGIPSRDEYVAAYMARTGLDPRPDLPIYLAYNFFRVAAILQGIVGRVRDGTATNENAPARAQLVRPLAERAWAFAQQAGAR